MSLILVIGASTGLGLATAQASLAGGHDVVVHAHTPFRVPPGGWRGTLTGDLSDLDAVKHAREADAFGRFDAVVHNAGTLHSPDAVRVNTIAPFVLTASMHRPERLICLSSSMHRGGGTDLEGLRTGSGSYSDRKLWVTTMALALARRWPDTLIHAVDPVWVPTRMGGAGAPDDLREGHRTQVHLATDEPFTPRTGGYWHHLSTQRPADAAAATTFQELLLAALAETTGVPLAE